MQLHFNAAGHTYVANVLADDAKVMSEQITLEPGESTTSLVPVFPGRCDAVVVASKEPISVDIGGATYPVGPLPLVWTRKANQGKPIADGEKRVDITVTNSGETSTLVSIATYH
jgi:hypothetical protein